LISELRWRELTEVTHFQGQVSLSLSLSPLPPSLFLSFSLFSHTSRMEGSIAQMMLMRPPLLTEKKYFEVKKKFFYVNKHSYFKFEADFDFYHTEFASSGHFVNITNHYSMEIL
jgi:hypothetical protein